MGSEDWNEQTGTHQRYSGPDGSYLAKLLFERGYDVWGSCRDAEQTAFNNARYLGIYDSLHLVSLNLRDIGNAIGLLKQIRPDEVFSLAGQSSVGRSFEQPVGPSKASRSARLRCLRRSAFRIQTFVSTTPARPSVLAIPEAELQRRAHDSILAVPMSLPRHRHTGLLRTTVKHMGCIISRGSIES